MAQTADVTRPGWSVEAIDQVREPYRSLASELLTMPFPASTVESAEASTADLARRLVRRGLQTEKTELLGAIQRVPADSEQGRRIRLRLRELDVERQRLDAED